ncbi:hypothetical protein NHX12_024208, partial [Muraenolepis orangiensis]
MDFHGGGIVNNVPAFLTKLWSLVEDPDTDQLILWSPNGTSFHVLEQARFSKEVLPRFFKHNNMTSFIRQLNMYGFRKVVHMEQGGLLKPEKDDTEFQHPFFSRGQEHLLDNIKRKVPPVSTGKQEEVRMCPEDVSHILTDMQLMKGKQENIDYQITTMKHENEALWREVATLRQKHTQQQKVVNKLIQFLMSLVQPNRVLGMKRKIPLMLNDSSSAHSMPKYGRQFSLEPLQATPAISAPAGSVKSRPIISDITELVTPTEVFSSDWIDALWAPPPQLKTHHHNYLVMPLTTPLTTPMTPPHQRRELSDHLEDIDSSLENLHQLFNGQTINLDSSPLFEFFRKQLVQYSTTPILMSEPMSCGGGVAQLPSLLQPHPPQEDYPHVSTTTTSSSTEHPLTRTRWVELFSDGTWREQEEPRDKNKDILITCFRNTSITFYQYTSITCYQYTSITCYQYTSITFYQYTSITCYQYTFITFYQYTSIAFYQYTSITCYQYTSITCYQYTSITCYQYTSITFYQYTSITFYQYTSIAFYQYTSITCYQYTSITFYQYTSITFYQYTSITFYQYTSITCYQYTSITFYQYTSITFYQYTSITCYQYTSITFYQYTSITCYQYTSITFYQYTSITFYQYTSITCYKLE